MNIFKIVFSPTGGTKRAADFITAEWGNNIVSLDLTDSQTDFSKLSFDKGDAVLIAVPSYGGRVPELAAERLSKINGNQARCVIVCVYGNRAYEDTLVELEDIAEESNFRVISAAAAIAEHSIIHQYASGRPDKRDEAELRDFGKKILEKIKNPAEESVLHIPGSRPYKNRGKGGLIPTTNEKCTACGLCAEKCPSQAISKNDPKITDSEKCIHCMRCVVRCPQSAREINEAAVSAVAAAIKEACSERKSNELYI